MVAALGAVGVDVLFHLRARRIGVGLFALPAMAARDLEQEAG